MRRRFDESRRPGRSRRFPNRSTAGFLPTMVSGNVLWLRADAGVTLSSASVNSDMTEATNAWTKSSCTRADGQSGPSGGTSAIKITDTNDGAPTQHAILNALTNLQAGPVMLDNLWVKAGTLIQIQANIGTGLTGYIDTTAKTYTAVTGDGTGQLMSESGAWQRWRIRGTYVAGANCILYTASSGSNSYQGDGTGTVFLGTGATYGPKLYQDRVSAWADQSGNANHGTQGTAASQMLYQELGDDGLWVPTGTSGTVKRVGWLADAERSVALPAPFYQTWNGDSVPLTIVQIVTRVAATSTGRHTLGLAGATAILATPSLTAANALWSNYKDDAATSKAAGFSSTLDTSMHSLATVFDGTNESMYLDGVADVSNPLNKDVGVSTFTSGVLVSRSMTRREIAVFSAALSDADRVRVENGMRARWGLALL